MHFRLHLARNRIFVLNEVKDSYFLITRDICKKLNKNDTCKNSKPLRNIDETKNYAIRLAAGL